MPSVHRLAPASARAKATCVVRSCLALGAGRGHGRTDDGGARGSEAAMWKMGPPAELLAGQPGAEATGQWAVASELADLGTLTALAPTIAGP